MQKVISVDTMRQSDAFTIKNYIESKELMYKAGNGVYHSYDWYGKVAIVCGSGNNAGDGYVLALLLKQSNIECRVFLLSSKFSDDGKYYFDRCVESGIFIEKCGEDTSFSEFDIIVDCIFGTGFSGSVKGIASVIIDKINNSDCKIVSVDINSGLNGDSGLSEKCVKSDLTVSIGYFKTGHFLNQAKENIKSLCNCDIGIELVGHCYYLVDAGDFKSVISERANYSHVEYYGYVTIIGGCSDYSCAVKLANMSCAALRIGYGSVRLVVPKSVAVNVAPHVLESTLYTIDDNDGFMKFIPEQIDSSLSHSRAVAIGMGWGQGKDDIEILRYILLTYDIPVIINAEGINTLSLMDLSILKTTKCSVTITLHIKEFERLSGYSANDITSNPVMYAEKFAKDFNVVVLLKGPAIVISDGKITYISNRGCPDMASAEGGDIISGIILGIYGYNKHQALNSACAAYIAGVSSELAQSEMNSVGMILSDTIRYIPDAVREIYY
ncbi:MAG TPA: NAD(P)H-hydrate dehydratase [Clostridia bacterium]|nr:NAD(P)H-hydrate dehydratase [Clostridia bacterium]